MSKAEFERVYGKLRAEREAIDRKVEQVKTIESKVAIIKEACRAKQHMANETKKQAVKAKQQTVKRFTNAMKAFKEKEKQIRELPELISEEALKAKLFAIEAMCDKEIALADELVKACTDQAVEQIAKHEEEAAQELKAV